MLEVLGYPPIRFIQILFKDIRMSQSMMFRQQHFEFNQRIERVTYDYGRGTVTEMLDSI